MYKAIEKGSLRADKEIITDAYRAPKDGKEQITDPRFPNGQTRMRAPIGYDPKPTDKDAAAKMSDSVKFGDNWASFGDIRNLVCQRFEDEKVEEKIREEVARRQELFTQRSAMYKPLAFGTSGLRADDADLTDMEVYINARGFIEYFISEGERGAICAIKRGDTVVL